MPTTHYLFLFNILFFFRINYFILFQQLKKNFGGKITATFPPRKILSLTAVQIEERREQLERYLQDVCQDTDVAYSSVFSGFLRNCQKVTKSIFLYRREWVSFSCIELAHKIVDFVTDCSSRDGGRQTTEKLVD